MAEDPAAYFKQEGIVSFRNSDFDDAILCFEKALGFVSTSNGSLSPCCSSSELHHLMAYALFQKGEHVPAIEAYQKAVALKREDSKSKHSDQAWMYYRLGECYLVRGEPEEARKYLDQALAAIDEGNDLAIARKIEGLLSKLDGGCSSTCLSQKMSNCGDWNVKAAKVILKPKKTFIKMAQCSRLGSGQLSSDILTVSLDAV